MTARESGYSKSKLSCLISSYLIVVISELLDTNADNNIDVNEEDEESVLSSEESPHLSEYTLDSQGEWIARDSADG